jgi:hypothetical protein
LKRVSCEGFDRVADGSREYRRDGVWFGGKEEELGDFLEKRNEDKGLRALRIWAGPEIRFSEVKPVIRNAVEAGIGVIVFAVKATPDSEMCQDLVMELYLDEQGEIDRICRGLTDLMIGESGQLSHRDESGALNLIEVEGFIELLELAGMVEKRAGDRSMPIRMFVDGRVGCQGFLDAWAALLKGGIKRGIWIYRLNDDEEPVRERGNSLIEKKPKSLGACE